MLATLIDLDPIGSADVITIASVFVAAVGILLAGRYAKRQVKAAGEQLRSAREQLERQTQTTRGEFLLSLQERFAEHNDIHLRLRNQPSNHHWWSGEAPSGEEWAEVEAYMGLFERVWILVEGKSVDVDVIERLYGYRVENIVMNDEIRTAKLEHRNTARFWIDFIELWRALDGARTRRCQQAVCAKHPAPAPPYPFDGSP